MGEFEFWCRWLTTGSWMLVLFGLALAPFNHTPLFDSLFGDRVNPVFWRAGGVPGEAMLFRPWIYGVLGATLSHDSRARRLWA